MEEGEEREEGEDGDKDEDDVEVEVCWMEKIGGREGEDWGEEEGYAEKKKKEKEKGGKGFKLRGARGESDRLD